MGSVPLGMFPIFLQRTADVLAPRLSVVFRRLVLLASFQACWRQANVTPIPRVYRPISITSVLSKVFGVLPTAHIICLSERSGYL